MRKGRVKFSKKLIERALNFPTDWKIEDVYYDDYNVRFVISGKDFPEVSERGWIKSCEVIIHKENVKFEVKPIV